LVGRSCTTRAMFGRCAAGGAATSGVGIYL
jgi:hypothetical protein